MELHTYEKLNRIVTGAVIAVIFMGTITLVSFVYAQNSTQTTASEAFGTSIGAAMIAIIGIISAGLALVKSFVDRGLLDKRVGTAVTMAADAAVAIRDNRQQIQDLAQNTYEIVQIASPETAQKITTKIQPVVDQATQRINEYTPKVEKFTQIANSINKNGEKTTDGIKEIKEQIPDEIVPS